MANFLSHFLLFSLFITLTTSTPSPSPVTSSAQQHLKTLGFPTGLLPANIKTYSINKTTGDFVVNLTEQCKFNLPPDNYLATYSKTVKGKISENKIGDLEGIRVWAMFKWWYITGIRSSGDNLVFEVGMVTAKYPSKNFDISPDCYGLKADS